MSKRKLVPPFLLVNIILSMRVVPDSGRLLLLLSLSFFISFFSVECVACPCLFFFFFPRR